MADVQPQGGGGGGRHEKKRAKRSSTHIDMTPMVDLAFLLLTFFILTTTMYKPSTLQLTFPVPQDEQDKKELQKVANAMTVFLTKDDQILYYKDAFEPGVTQLTRTNFSEITKVLIENNRSTFEQVQELRRRYNANEIDQLAFDTLKNNLEKRDEALFVIIKPDKDAKYRNMIDMVDEMDITGVGKYAVQDTIKPTELALLEAEKLKF
ncbi:MAG: biopolymer transporter ExbD [Flavobacteriales bacterium]|nr:biopolymer transporter ExbD [Flavobacteriales bacterium]MEB2340939.1 biopolymer transporter ExbD [Flavobacteriia bacterium]